ncbi:MAG: shikimate dehydrogenase [Rhizomicrobium sp.]
MKVAGVIGWPIAHSLSPRLHSFWIREHGVDGAYVPLPAKPQEFSNVLCGLRAAGFVGVNVTLPHKEAAFAVAHVYDGASRTAGAANRLIFRDGCIEAGNSDVAGLQASLVHDMGPDALRGRQVIVLGAGGAARAAVLACDNLKAGTIHILNRTRRRVDNLVEDLGNSVSAMLSANSPDAWSALAPGTHLLVNATSAGMRGTASSEQALELLRPDAVVCDTVYDPLETPLLARARSLGLRSFDGLGMLMHQAVPAFEAFFGIRPTVSAALRADLENALR